VKKGSGEKGTVEKKSHRGNIEVAKKEQKGGAATWEWGKSDTATGRAWCGMQ